MLTSKKLRIKPEFYLSVSIKFHPQCHLLHLDVFLVIAQLPDIVCPLLDQDVEAKGGGHANADADQHNVPDMKDYDVSDMEDNDVPDMEDYDVHDMKKWKIKQDVPDMDIVIQNGSGKNLRA